jgi:hypothetical protein
MRYLAALTAMMGLFVIPSPQALAWGAEGHRISALIAADEFTPIAKSQVQSLLGSPDARAAMEDASTLGRRNQVPTARHAPVALRRYRDRHIRLRHEDVLSQ